MGGGGVSHNGPPPGAALPSQGTYAQLLESSPYFGQLVEDFSRDGVPPMPPWVVCDTHRTPLNERPVAREFVVSPQIYLTL